MSKVFSNISDMKGEKCAERDGSGMLLWQHEFYYVLEREEQSRRISICEKGVTCRKKKEGMTRKLLREMWVLEVAYAPALKQCADV